MTDEMDRVFVGIKYEAGPDDEVKSELISNLMNRLEGFPHEFEITLDRPPRIFTEEELLARFFNLYKTAEKFAKRFNTDFGEVLEVDPRLLYISVISAFDDIERYKSYHLEKPFRDRSDAVKRTAYLTKWLVKLSPFQIRFDSDIVMTEGRFDSTKINAKPALANILFAIMVAMTHISIECQKRAVLSTDAEFNLAYDLLYRRVNEDGLIAKYQKFMDILNGNNILQEI
jgi:hypothetical protein